MRWDGPILTDSGGYQAFSLSKINSIDEEGVMFQSIIDGSRVHLGPERSMQVQNNLGADIIMAFDDCPPADPSKNQDREASEGECENDSCSESAADEPVHQTNREHAARVRLAHERTIRWLHRCVKAHTKPREQALFGIVQGGTDLDLRAASVEAICNIDLPGYAIGGVAVGESAEMIHAVVRQTAPLMPADKPRYLMGVGYERDVVAAVQAGVDMFDCVLPTRNGRTGHAFTRSGRIQLRNATHREHTGPIDPKCDCLACAGGFGRAYLRHLFQADEMLGPILVSIHNIRHFQRLMLDIRRAIREDAWSLFRQAWPVAFAGMPEVIGNGADPMSSMIAHGPQHI
jgi:queuine tRNA-ribosyltransferase